MVGKAAFEKILNNLRVGGITVTWWDGETKTYGPDKPKVGIHIKDKKVIGRMAKNISLGFGESYMEGLIDIDGDPHDVLILANRNAKAFPHLSNRSFLKLMRGVTLGASTTQSRKDISHHYDIGNEFYELWLDESMSYSCAYFKKKSDSLKQAQLQKIDHILKKLILKKGQTLLDIGSGWGWLIIRAANQYGVKAHGITHSKEQVEKTKERIKKEGLEKLVSVELKDYRDLKGKERYDRIVSVGMYEHVGRPNHKVYMDKVEQLLKPQGISLLHTITKNRESATDPWIGTYIFPGGYIPAWREVVHLLPEYGFHLIDAESLRMHYAMTLDHWAKNFEKHVDQIREDKGESFVRMWRLYLRASAAGFRSSGLDLHQFVFTKGLVNDLPLTREYIYH